MTISTWHCQKAPIHLRFSPDSRKHFTVSIKHRNQTWTNPRRWYSDASVCGWSLPDIPVNGSRMSPPWFYEDYVDSYHFPFSLYILSYDTSEWMQLWISKQSRTRYRTTAISQPNLFQRRSNMPTANNHRDHSATDITAERLHMEIEREDFWEPNRTKPLLQIFTEWHTKGWINYYRIAKRHTERSRNQCGTPYQTEYRMTLPEAYQMTTELTTDILAKLPTETLTEESTKKSTVKFPGNVYYQVYHDSLKHWRYWNQPPPEDMHQGRRIKRRRITGKDHGKRRSWPEGHRYLFRNTLVRSIYKSMPNANDYRNVWYHMKITEIVWSMWKHCKRARKSTSALKYLVSITTFWNTYMIDMPCTIDNHWRLRNMLVAEAPINDKLRAEAPINAESRAQAPIDTESRAQSPIDTESRAQDPIDTESRAEALPSRKVHLRLDLRLFHFAFG